MANWFGNFRWNWQTQAYEEYRKEILVHYNWHGNYCLCIKKTGSPTHNFLMCRNKHFYLEMFLHGTHKRIITSPTLLIKTFCYPSKLIKVLTCVGEETTKILDVYRSKVSYSLSWKTNHKQQQSFWNSCTISQHTMNINAKF